MSDLVRLELVAEASPIVVKMGTRVLTQPDGRLCGDRINDLAQQINTLVRKNHQVIVVSSGAVGAGVSELQLKSRPADLAMLQAVAAIGQTKLIEAYDRTFRQHGYHAAQILLTARDFHDRTSYLNVRNTLLSLLKLNAIPVINENDSVAVDELMTTFGDNDQLAALVTNLVRAPLLIILSDVDGLFDGPVEDANSRLISSVTKIDEKVLSYVRDRKTGLSKGGMASKLRAARMATVAGENVVLANGHESDILIRIVNGEPVGTAFLATGKPVTPRKRWIGFSVQPSGKLILDDGACQAVVNHGRSLLAIGVAAIEGDFTKGDVVLLCDPNRQELARGLTNYGAAELHRIIGLHSQQISDVLGHRPYEEVVHRDNMTLTQSD